MASIIVSGLSLGPCKKNHVNFAVSIRLAQCLLVVHFSKMIGLKSFEKSRNDFNIFVLSLSFFFLFAAFFTMGNVQTVILDSAQDKNSTGYVEVSWYIVVVVDSVTLVQFD